MGKCLSCCRRNLPSDFQGNEDMFVDINKGSILSKPPEMSGDAGRRRSANSDTLISMNSNGETFTNSCSRNSSSEKWSFYPRIPPILGSNSSESKRQSSHHTREFSEGKINAFFDQYKDPTENAILSDGIEHLCADLNIRPEEFQTLLLAWKFNAQQMCCFTKEEFVEGCRNLKVDSIQGIQGKLPELVREIQEPEKFKDFYRFTFKFGLDDGQRVLMADMAIQLWKLVFFYNEPPILQRWLAFLEKHPNVQSISKDTWNMFLNFSEAVGNDLSSYDDTEAWPSLFDDFVEYENDQTNQNVLPSKDKCVLEI